MHAGMAVNNLFFPVTAYTLWNPNQGAARAEGVRRETVPQCQRCLSKKSGETEEHGFDKGGFVTPTTPQIKKAEVLCVDIRLEDVALRLLRVPGPPECCNDW